MRVTAAKYLSAIASPVISIHHRQRINENTASQLAHHGHMRLGHIEGDEAQYDHEADHEETAQRRVVQHLAHARQQNGSEQHQFRR